MTATMRTAEIMSANPDRLVTKHDAMELLGLTRPPAWRELVQDGEIAIFQPAAGPRPACVLMRSLQDYVQRQAARAEEVRSRRFCTAQKGTAARAPRGR